MTRKHRKLLTYLSRYYRRHRQNPTVREACRWVGVEPDQIKQMVSYLLDGGELFRTADGRLLVTADHQPSVSAPQRPRAGDNIRTAPDAQHLVSPILSLFAQRDAERVAS